MSRSGYTEDYPDEYPELAIGRWRNVVARASRGKRGQAFFRDLVSALDAMPEKRLIADALEDGGEVCAIGALGRARGIDMTDLDPEEPEDVAAAINVAPALVRETTFLNDEAFSHGSPEERWVLMRRWAASNIKGESPCPPHS